jgi:nucleotide-binding universal stress UspA family protein
MSFERRAVVVGVDGSDPATRALEWSARYASAFGAELIVVHVAETLGFGPALGPYDLPMHPYSEQELDQLRDKVTRDWCKPLADAAAGVRVVVQEGIPALLLIEIARRENAELIVTGRRGRGGFAELLLGSTSHKLVLHADRPVSIIP